MSREKRKRVEKEDGESVAPEDSASTGKKIREGKKERERTKDKKKKKDLQRIAQTNSIFDWEKIEEGSEHRVSWRVKSV